MSAAPDEFHLSCPRCGLTITPRAEWLTLEHCPRCVARGGALVRLFRPNGTYPLTELLGLEGNDGLTAEQG